MKFSRFLILVFYGFTIYRTSAKFEKAINIFISINVQLAMPNYGYSILKNRSSLTMVKM